MKLIKTLCFCLLLLAVLVPSFALAEGEVIPTDPFSWEYLATIAGSALATMLIVQLLKLPLDRVWKIPTRIVVFFISLVIMLLANLFTVGLDWSSALLTIFNAVISALTAMGGYELSFAKLEHKE